MSQPAMLRMIGSAGFGPDDDDEMRLKKSLLVFATGLVCVGSMLWLLLYWWLGPKFSSTMPLVFQALLVTNLIIFLRTGNFTFFRFSQLALFLFSPFVVQWSIGTFITASGISLWGLLAPVGALLLFGVRDSLAWFFAYIVFTALSGFFDYFLADAAIPVSAQVPARVSVFFFALNFASVSTIVYLLLRFAIDEREEARLQLESTHRLLLGEQERSERLLLNILPEPIADRLKHDDQTIADGFADVTVMFVDIVNFTQLAEGLTPREVFSMLNRVFSAFDELAEQFGLEKIKTIGDAYMVAGGLNSESTDYTAAMAGLALEMRDLLRRDFIVNNLRIDVRIGIGTGPVVAGVVGKKKFIYDLWGDTVNLASRLTGEGLPGSIQVDVATWERLAGRFAFDGPEYVELKGKGLTPLYRLTGVLAAK